MTERKLATIRKIAEVQPIPGADAIEALRVDGWWVVGKKGEFQLDELVVYLEVDSWVPTALAPFLTKPGHFSKVFEEVQGERLRTIKLRGQLSQGLILPISKCIEVNGCWSALQEGTDCTEWLNIKKYEKPLSAALAGTAKGNFPSFIPKTDQERIQNCTKFIQNWIDTNELFEVTEKLDGSSMTVFVNGEDSGVCSRNLELKFDEGNSFWQAAVKYNLIDKIKSTERNLAIQGELIGEGIQGNSYGLVGREFYCFDIWDIDNRVKLLPVERVALLNLLGINSVPMIGIAAVPVLESVKELLLMAEGISEIGTKPKREGLVWKSLKQADVSFKAISNAWLLKEKE